MDSNSKQLYELMISKGYQEDFASLVASEMHGEWTSMRMTGYINKAGLRPLEEVADEMLAILSDRDKIVQKHMLENAQASINRMYREGFESEE